MQTLNERDIAWANWDYKGSFGIVDASGQDTGIASVLLAREADGGDPNIQGDPDGQAVW